MSKILNQKQCSINLDVIIIEVEEGFYGSCSLLDLETSTFPTPEGAIEKIGAAIANYFNHGATQVSILITKEYFKE